MPESSLDVVGIGNAIVDVLAHESDAGIARLGLSKGTMTLIDEHNAHRLYDLMGPAVEVSGGSAANTMAGIASFGGRAAFVGKVRNDQLGGIFRHDIRAAGVDFDTPAAEGGPPSARCMIFVTPDAQRTMQTYLGAAIELGVEDIDTNLISSASVTYLEGYLWDSPKAREALVKAAHIAHQAGRKVAFTLSDPFCVDRHRDAFRAFVAHHVDILFANEAEIESLYLAASFDQALQAVRGACDIAALTRSARGAVVLRDSEVHVIDAAPVKRVIDTTGAGDLYAAGFLYGLTQGKDLATAGRLGALAAAEIISHFGARPETPLAELLGAQPA
ncbi:MAG: adenosine kinase [Alphaproteobacteria bacterium]